MVKDEAGTEQRPDEDELHASPKNLTSCFNSV